MAKTENVLDAYEIHNLLGEGGFGVVYAGVSKITGQPVVIKHVAKSGVFDWIMDDGVKTPSEIALLTSCQHIERVVKLLEYYERPDSFVLIFERLDPCKDLFDTISDHSGRLPLNLVKCYGKQIVEIVYNLFTAGIVHRDIKDENFLVCADTVYIIDFGAATFVQDEPYHQFNGTREYAPPEWYFHGCYFAESSTVWAIGVLFYNMLVGQFPFEDGKEIVAGSSAYPDDTPSEFRKLVTSCLEYNPEDRPSLIDVLNHSFLE